jgi:hypothetical protein
LAPGRCFSAAWPEVELRSGMASSIERRQQKEKARRRNRASLYWPRPRIIDRAKALFKFGANVVPVCTGTR